MTMSGRDAILQRVRRSLRVEDGDDARRQTVASRLQTHPIGIIPERSGKAEPERIAAFKAAAEGVSATVDLVGHPDHVAQKVSEYLRKRNLPASIRLGTDDRLRDIGWETMGRLEIEHGASDGSDVAGVSRAFAGIAETGTLMLLSGPDNPTTINFLCEHHIVVLDTADLHGNLEAAWASLRARFGGGVPPRTVNLITGPSRSADIEQTLLLGAHGPRALHIVILQRSGGS